MEALPPNKSYDDKYYIGFFENDSLVASMDLVLGYPTEEITFIGFFMTNVQIKGIHKVFLFASKIDFVLFLKMNIFLWN